MKNKKCGYIYLAWGGNGNRIKEVMESVGLTVEWNGTDTQRIKVF